MKCHKHSIVYLWILLVNIILCNNYNHTKRINKTNHRKRCRFISSSDNDDDDNTYKHDLHQVDNSNNYEIVYVTNGQLTNLTCFIQAREIDWHFKDKNASTNVISNGLRLQIIKRVHHKSNNEDYDFDEQKQQTAAVATTNLFKYRVSSDERSYHMLSILIQGKQDEGIYQCVDSKSETPIKKNIKLLLKNDKQSINNLKNSFQIIILIYFISIFISI